MDNVLGMALCKLSSTRGRERGKPKGKGRIFLVIAFKNFNSCLTIPTL